MNEPNALIADFESDEPVVESRLSAIPELTTQALAQAQLRRFEILAETNAPLSILVADDEKRLLDLICMSVRAMGHTVVAQCQSGAEAIKKAFEMKPDLVIIDVMMPGGNGIDAANSISQSLAIPAIVSTALTNADTMARVRASQIKAYLVKPFSPAQLQSAICVAVAQHRQDLYTRCRLFDLA